MYTFVDSFKETNPKTPDCVAVYDVRDNRGFFRFSFMIFKWGEKKYHCCVRNDFMFEGTLQEAIIACKKTYYDPEKLALDNIKEVIDASVSKAKHTMDLRIAKYRGFLFDQVVTLKYGANHKNEVMDAIIAEVEKPGIIGRAIDFFKPFKL